MHVPFLHRSRPTASPDASPASTGATASVVVYGGDWCTDCHVVTRFLEARQVRYRWVDLGQDEAARRRLEDAGYRAIPVVVLADGRTLIEPSTRELAAALGIA